MPRNYSWPRALYLCFFSADLYRDIALRWQGVGLAWLLMLQVIIITPVFIAGIYIADGYLFSERNGPSVAQQSIDEITAQMPEIRWKDGVLSSPAPQPYVITTTFQGEEVPLAVIDEQASLGDLRDMEAAALITSEGFHLRKNDNDYETRYWQDLNQSGEFDDLILDAQSSRALGYTLLDAFKENRVWIYSAFGLFLWALILLLLFMWRVIQLLFFAPCMCLMALMRKQDVPFEMAMRLCAMALTPAILLSVVCAFISVPLSPWLFILMTLGYSWFALKALADT
jgi:hypothetical protein